MIIGGRGDGKPIYAAGANEYGCYNCKLLSELQYNGQKLCNKCESLLQEEEENYGINDK